MHKTSRIMEPALPHRFVLPVVRELPAQQLHDRQVTLVLASLAVVPRRVA